MTTKPVTSLQADKMTQLVKVKIQYKDAHGDMKGVIAYVPKNKVGEMHKAKNIQLNVASYGYSLE